MRQTVYTKIGFTTFNDLSGTVKVYVDQDFKGTPFFSSPPHAGFAPVLAYLDRGENYHGSLRERLYACTDKAWDVCRIVLWVGDNGSQNDDDIGRLTPIAWIDLEEQEEQEDEDAWQFPDHPPLLAAMLTAMLAHWIKAGWLGTTELLEAGDVLDQDTLDRCWENAHKLASTLEN